MFSFIFKSFLVFVVFSLSLSLIAEAALPGDVLYNFKIGVNEKVKGLFVGEQGAVAFQIGLLNERLSEIDGLVKTGKLDAGAANIAKKQVAAQLESTTAAVTSSAYGNLSPEQKASFLASLENIKQALIQHQNSLNQLVDVTAANVSVDRISDSIDLAGVTDSFTGMIESLTNIATDTLSDVIDDVALVASSTNSAATSSDFSITNDTSQDSTTTTSVSN